MNPFLYTGRDYDSETGLQYYRARYYSPSIGRFLSEDPSRFTSGTINFYPYVTNDPIDFYDPSGLRDYNEQETQDWLQQAYSSATAGRVRGIANIHHNSQGGGPYDFGHDPNGIHQDDTWTRCGRKMNAWQFGNYIAGFQGAAYDEKYFWTTGAVKAAGLYYHLTGDTDAQNDPFDRTGFPDINNGEKDGWNFFKNGGKCPACSESPKSPKMLTPYEIYVLTHQ